MYRDRVVQGLQQRGPAVPRHVGRAEKHVVANQARRGDEVHVVWFQPDFLEVFAHHCTSPVEMLLQVSHSLAVHFVHADHNLVKAQRVSQQSVFTDLPLAGVTSGKLRLDRGDDEHRDVRLRHRNDGVLHEVVVARGVDECEAAPLRGELPERGVHGTPALALAAKLVQNPRIPPVVLAAVDGLGRDPVETASVDRPAIGQQMTSSGGLPTTTRPNEDQIGVWGIAGLEVVLHLCTKPWSKSIRCAMQGMRRRYACKHPAGDKKRIPGAIAAANVRGGSAGAAPKRGRRTIRA
mmetsp:Transcript_35458/g.97939  ORF Transcript_35458/g.97939 Transcript_35458/m.97939 type:complete len:293 (+) Transcript_35458:1165-2043(+)